MSQCLLCLEGKYKESSFSEEKEAKRFLCSMPAPAPPARPTIWLQQRHKSLSRLSTNYPAHIGIDGFSGEA
jgi:hypothetical protein